MSEEYKTLDQWFEGKDRGDGRKFKWPVWADCHYFEPMFRDNKGTWYGLTETGAEFHSNSYTEYEEWHPPKTKKKVTLYRPVRYDVKNGVFVSYEQFSSEKEAPSTGAKIVGWMEVEVLVDY